MPAAMATVQHANFIQYGRRAGKNKSAPDLHDGKTNYMPVKDNSFGPMVTAQGIDLRQMKMIPQQEYQRIQNSLHEKDREREENKRNRFERNKLHAQSKEIVSNWSNTIVGQRQAKLAAKRNREEEEEEHKVKLDIEEQKYQASKRKAAIEKAKTTQYFQTDRIKSFHGALLLSEVLKERDAQVELKKQRSSMESSKDLELFKSFRKQYDHAVVEDQQKAKERLLERRKIADYQKTQIKQRNLQKEEQKMEDRREGEEIQRLIKLHEWEQEKLKELKRNEKKKILSAHENLLLNKRAIHAMGLQQEEEEDNEIRTFAAAKKKMMKLRQQREAELFREEMKHKEKMTSLLATHLKKKIDDEDVRIERAAKEQEAKKDEELRRKEERRRRELSAIEAHRNEQQKRKDRKAKEDKAETFRLQELKLQADRSFAEKHAERTRKLLSENQKMQDFRRAQVNERAENERNLKREELLKDEKSINVLAVEEEQFKQYADKVIYEAEKRDWSTYPLIKAAQAGIGGGRGPAFEGKGGIRPSYLTCDGYGVQLPSHQRSSTESIKANCNPANGAKVKKRLGFVW